MAEEKIQHGKAVTSTGNGHKRLTFHATHDGRLYVDPDELIKDYDTQRKLGEFADLKIERSEAEAAKPDTAS